MEDASGDTTGGEGSSDDSGPEVRPQGKEVIRLQCAVKKVSTAESSPTPLVKTTGFRHLVGSNNGFQCSL